MKTSLGSRFQYLIPDVLGQIFIDSLLDYDSPSWDAYPAPTILESEHWATSTCSGEAPLKLGRICSHWREVALSTPMLWSTLHLMIDDSSHDRWPFGVSDKKAAIVAKNFMDRSSNLPLSITLRCFRRNPPLRNETALIANELLLHKSRWKLLKLRTIGYDILLSALRMGSTSLNSMDIGSCPGLTQFLSGLKLDNIPSLSHLRLNDISCSLSPQSRRLVNMRSLQISGGIDGLMQWIRHCPNLARLEISLSRLSNIPNGVEIQELSSLTELIIDSSPTLGSRVQVLIDYLWTPVLRSLSITMRNRNPASSTQAQTITIRNEFATHLHDFLHRSSPPLEKLAIDSAGIPWENLLGILGFLHLLQELELSAELSIDPVVKALTYPSNTFPTTVDPAPLCSQLRRIKMTVTDSDLSQINLINMISSRSRIDEDPVLENGVQGVVQAVKPEQRLDEIVIIDHANAFQSLKSHPVIASCIDEGLRLTICRSPQNHASNQT